MTERRHRTIQMVARLISYSLTRWYGFEALSAERLVDLEDGLNTLDIKTSIHSANASFGAGTADRVLEIANAAQKLAALNERDPDLNEIRAHLVGSGTVEVDGMAVSIRSWLRAAPAVYQALRELSEVLRSRPLSGGLMVLESQTILAGEWLRTLYAETYPGSAFELGANRTRTRATVPVRWGPGPLFIAIATKALTGQRYDNGEAIRKARRSVEKARGD